MAAHYLPPYFVLLGVRKPRVALCLLLSEGADDGKDDALALVGAEQEVDPEDERGEVDQRIEHVERAERGNDAECDRGDDPSDGEKDGLEGVKAHFLVLVVRRGSAGRRRPR